MDTRTIQEPEGVFFYLVVNYESDEFVYATPSLEKAKQIRDQKQHEHPVTLIMKIPVDTPMSIEYGSGDSFMQE